MNQYLFSIFILSMCMIGYHLIFMGLLKEQAKLKLHSSDIRRLENVWIIFSEDESFAEIKEINPRFHIFETKDGEVSMVKISHPFYVRLNAKAGCGGEICDKRKEKTK